MSNKLFAYACVRVLNDYTVQAAPFVTNKAKDRKEANKLAKEFNESSSSDIVDSWEVGMELVTGG